MAVETIVVAFGAPRSGTTFLRTCVEALRDPFAFKLNEHAAFHPCRSDSGLLDLEKALHQKRVAFVRIVRDPLEIARSFVFARREEASRLLGGIGRNSDERVVEWIRSESRSVAAQRGARLRGRAGGTLRILEIRYERLAERAYREEVADRLRATNVIDDDDRKRFFVALGNFGRKPARAGRLSFGFDGDPLSKKERDFFERALADVRKAEGYAP